MKPAFAGPPGHQAKRLGGRVLPDEDLDEAL
jgi:hypothetical protein